jgi:diacylglycerol kinase (ATP)
MRIKVVINPAAGKAEPILSVLSEVFGSEIDWDVAVTHKAGDGVEAARRAADEGFDIIGAYGGDGTVTEVASALAAGGPPILLLPGGTGNALADDLGIPAALAEAVALAKPGASEVRRIDLGRWDDTWFVLRMTMGFEAEMVSSTSPDLKDRYGWLAYALSGLQAVGDASTTKYRLTIDGETAECEGLAAIVANSASTGVQGVRIAADVDVSDGLLDVVVVEQTNLPGLLGIAAAAAQGKASTLLSHWRGKEIRVESSPVQAVLADGEDAGRTPIDISVVPAAVGVLVPKAAD